MVAMRRLVVTLLALVPLAAAPPPAAAKPALPAHAAQMKRIQIRMMREGAMAEMRAARAHGPERRSALRSAPWRPPAPFDGHDAAPGARNDARGERRRPSPIEPPDPPGFATIETPAAAPAPAAATAIATNHIANNRSTDTALCSGAPCSGQCEVSIGAFGNNLLAAWNDGEGFVTSSSTEGFAYSTDNGVTWTDGGAPPVNATIGQWVSDPVVAVNEKTGEFYFSALCEPVAGSTNGIAVVRGAFSGGVLSWGAPNLVISGSDNTVVYDKEWMAADSLSGTLYLTFTKFTSASDEIDFCRNTTDNVGAWTAPIKLSSTTDNGLVQGSRVAVGPTGDVWTTWNAIGNPLTDIYDYMRVRRSTTNGASFGAEATGAQQILSNFGSGAPGFNRGTGFTFPGMAVDRGTGPHRGRVYLTWNESINFYDDNFGSLIAGNAVNEIETNDTPATATAFTMGKNLFGGMSTANDFDYWKFNGTQGQTIICELDSVYTTTLDASFRLFCSDGSTRLAYSESGFGGDNISQSLIVFTLPSTGTYYLRVASTTNDPLKPPGTGGYRIRTTLDTPSAGERARDHRDIFVTTSDNGTAWTTPVRVNGDVGHLDDWLPEVAVAPNGNAYCQWYDWRDASAPICGGASMTYLARSTDGGATWTDGSPVSSAVTNWTTTSANIAPNQGDYTALFANTNAVYSIWSDGRNGDPDAYMAAVNLSFTAVQVSLAATDVTPDRVRITWASSGGAGVVGTVYRRGGSDAWTVLGDVTSDGSGMLSYEDRAVTPGTRYVYRIGIHDPSGEILSGEVTIDVPLALAFGVRSVGANPSPGSVRVACSLPDAGTATLELIDVAGRRVDQQTLTGPGAPEVELAQGRSLAPGVYLVRLTHAGRSATTRVAVIR